jgi:hypothetical protein
MPSIIRNKQTVFSMVTREKQKRKEQGVMLIVYFFQTRDIKQKGCFALPWLFDVQSTAAD